MFHQNLAMRKRAKKWAMFILRWGIALFGIWWVVSQMNLRDHVLVLDSRNRPVLAGLAAPAEENSPNFQIWDPATGQKRVVPRSEVVNGLDQRNVTVTAATPEGTEHLHLLALDLSDDLRKVNRYLIEDPDTGDGEWLEARQVRDFQLKVPHPRVDVGIISLVWLAEPTLLWLAIGIFPITFILTSLRWNELLKAAGIRLGSARVFILTMVGAFYNTFMPGSTGGDVLKAYYASKHTDHRTRAVVSVVIDRIIGLLALVVLGGAMAGWQWFYWRNAHDPAALLCRRVALGSLLIIVASIVGGEVLTHPVLHRITGFAFIISRLPLNHHIQRVIHVMQLYRKRWLLAIGALAMTLPVHGTVVLSALLCGKAFRLPIPTEYYFVCVPVIVLAGAIPISPQGAGVMEFFAIQLTQQYGVTVSQAFALTMSIRVVQILWNLTGGIFVFRGGYHAPTEKEQEELELEQEREDGPWPLQDGAVLEK